MEKKRQKSTAGTEGKAMKWVDVENNCSSSCHAERLNESENHEFFTIKREWGKHSLPDTFLVPSSNEQENAKGTVSSSTRHLSTPTVTRVQVDSSRIGISFKMALNYVNLVSVGSPHKIIIHKINYQMLKGIKIKLG